MNDDRSTRGRFLSACESTDRDPQRWSFSPQVRSPRPGCPEDSREIGSEELQWALAEDTRQFRMLFEHFPAGIYLTDADGHCTYVNRRWCEMAGMSAQEARGEGWRQAIHPEDRESITHCWYANVESRSTWSAEYRMQTPSGKTTWVYGQATPLVNAGGEISGFLGINVPISQRRRIENRLQRLLESAPDATLVVDREGRIVLANAQAEAMFGFAQHELIGQAIEILVPASFRESHACRRTEYSGAPKRRLMSECPELVACRKDGQEFPAEISLSPVDTEGETLIVAAVRDISHRKRMEQALQLNFQVQAILIALLELGLEPISLKEQLERALELLFAVPWVELESKGAVFLAEGRASALVMAAQKGLSEPIPAGCGPDLLPRGYFSVPIVSGGSLLGVMTLYVKQGHHSKPEAEKLLVAVASGLAGIVKHSRTEASLRESEERFELAVRGTDAGIWDWDLRINQVFYSPRWKSMLGYAPEEVGHDYCEWETRLHPDDRQRALATIRDYLEGRTSEYELEHRLQHRDGTYRWILARGAVLRDEHGRPYRMAGSHLDVTERRQSELRLRHREAQLLAAQKIQEYLLPQGPPATPGFNIAGMVVPAEFAGGDYFDYLWLPDGALGIVVGDVSGHDVGAALVTASTSAHLRSFAEDHTSVEQILAHTNSILSREIGDGQFVTLLFVRLELASATLSYASAGHPSAYILRSNGDVAAVLDSTSLPLAVLPDTGFPVRGPISLESGDVVLLVTDGVLEARSSDGAQFGTERMLDVVRENLHREAREIVERLQEAVRRFSGLAEPQDDVTAVVVRVHPEHRPDKQNPCQPR